MVLRSRSRHRAERGPGAVAACLEVRQLPGESLTSSLVSFLRHKRVLLVLDNCEHVIDSAGTLAM